jgi:hypothetical protein
MTLFARCNRAFDKGWVGAFKFFNIGVIAAPSSEGCPDGAVVVDAPSKAGRSI